MYIMLLFSRGVVGMLSEGANEYLSVVILQLITFAFPTAIWYRLRGLARFDDGRGEYKTRLRLTRPRVSHIIIILAACFALMSGCLLFSISFSGESSMQGSFSLYDTFISKYNATPQGALWLILAYAALPAVCEELVFRGVLCAEYDRYGVVCSVVMNTVWFGFLHFNFVKLPVYLFAGLVLTVLLYATRSAVATMIAHFAYNLFGIFGQPYITEFYITAGSVGVAVTILIIVLLLSAAIFCGAAARLYAGYAKRDEPSDYREPTSRAELTKNFKECLLTPSAAVCVALYFAVALVLIFFG